jgi:N-methylhydantoinase B
MAAPEGGNTFVTFGGYDRTRGPWVHCDLIFGAWGGSTYRSDGDAMALIASNCTNIPIEVIEATYPLRCEQYAFVPDTGGAGKSRGGLSIDRDLRLVRGEAVLQVRADRQRFMPWPLLGGSPGTRSWNFINPDSSPQPLPAKFTVTLHEGDLFRHVTGGGGGYGPPLSRDPADVSEDVRNGKITPEHARLHYAVVTDAGGAVDLGATAALRAKACAKPRQPAAGAVSAQLD